MATLTNTKIKDTYDGLLKTTDNEALDVSGVTLIEDGLGNASALSVGRSGNGVSVSGLLDVSGEVQGTSLDINGAADISGNLAVDTNTLYVDATNNRVGIGTSSPTFNLEVENSSGQAILGITAQDGNYSTLLLGDVSNNYVNQIRTDHSANALTFHTATTTLGGNERMRIDSSGNVRLSGTAPSAENTISKIDFYNNSSSINLAGIEGKRTAGGTNYGSLIFNTTNSGTSSEKMRIDSSGNVGIGESNPTAVSSGATTLTIKGSTTTKGGALLLRSSDNSVSSYIYPDSTNGLTFGSLSNHNVRFISNSAERMRITSDGEIQHTTGVVSYIGKKTVTKVASNGGGANIFATQFGSSTPQVGHIYVTESGTTNYAIIAAFKENSTTNVVTNIISNSGITVNATNASGTVALTGFSNTNNVRMKAVIEEC